MHAIMQSAAKSAAITYYPSDRLELKVRLYMEGGALSSQDVDNRLKDIMDALQGRAGGSKKIRQCTPIIPNDKQVYRVTVEKALAPKQSKGFGHVLITRHKNS